MINAIDAIKVRNITNTYAEPLVDEIMGIYISVRDLDDNEVLQDSSNHLEAILQRLDYLIAVSINDTYVENILHELKFTCVFDSIARFRSLYTAKLEIEHAHLILNSNNPWEILTNFSYLQNY
ncbi:MAG: methyltransferase, partial [Methanosarcinales archaeon]|nr:methyltransferase [Methanosarcinales archaeon]